MSESQRSQFHDWLDQPQNARAHSELRTLVSIFQELPDDRKKLLEDLSGLQVPDASAARKSVLPPGYPLATLLRFLLTPAAFNRYLYPVIADMQVQYIDAVAAGRKWAARWIVVRQHLCIFVSWNWLYAFLIREIIKFVGRGHW